MFAKIKRDLGFTESAEGGVFHHMIVVFISVNHRNGSQVEFFQHQHIVPSQLTQAKAARG